MLFHLDVIPFKFAVLKNFKTVSKSWNIIAQLHRILQNESKLATVNSEAVASRSTSCCSFNVPEFMEHDNIRLVLIADVRKDD